MTTERTTRHIQSEIIQLQSCCHPPANREQLVRQLIEEFQVVSQKELQEALVALPFSVVCSNCDQDAPATYELAVQAGWQEIEPSDGFSWNFLGTCPDCSQE